MSLGVASPQELHNIRMQEEQLRHQGSLVFSAGRPAFTTGAGSNQPIQLASPPHDVVAHPKHYTSHPSGVECITIAEHMGFNLGNVLKYIWRADLKNEVPVQDLEKAAWYLNREIQKRKNT